MPRILRIRRDKKFACSLMQFGVFVNNNAVGSVRNGGIFACTVRSDIPLTINITALGKYGIGYVAEYIVSPGETVVDLALHMKVNLLSYPAYQLIETCTSLVRLPLSNIEKVNKDGIEYRDETGKCIFLLFKDAYAGWLEEYGGKKSRKWPYVCDKSSLDGEIKFIFHPGLVFYTNSSAANEEARCFTAKLNTYGKRVFDYD